MLCPSRVILPVSGWNYIVKVHVSDKKFLQTWYNLNRRLARVLLPLPLPPTTATTVLAGMSRSRFLRWEMKYQFHSSHMSPTSWCWHQVWLDNWSWHSQTWCDQKECWQEWFPLTLGCHSVCQSGSRVLNLPRDLSSSQHRRWTLPTVQCLNIHVNFCILIG